MKDKIQTFVGIVGRNLTGQNNILNFLRDIWVRGSEKVKEMKETKELKKCPFCGGEAEIVGYKFSWIVCKECSAETGVFDTKIEAIKAWNRRVEE